MNLESILRDIKTNVKRIFVAGLISSAFLLSCAKDDSNPTQANEPPEQQNRNPVITSSPPTQVNENNPYAYYISANDPDGDTKTYSLIQKPNWLSISDYIVSGRAPEVSQNADYPVKIRVSDGKGGTADQSWNLTVRNVSNVRVVPEYQLNQISDIEDNSITFSQPVEFSQNDIIVAGISNTTPNGFLREVTSISGNRKIIQTRQATFEQAIETSSFSYSEELSPQSPNPAEFIKGVGQSEIAESDDFKFNISLGNVVLFDLDGNENTTEDQLIANGNISFNTRTNLDIRVSNHTLTELSFRNSTDIESDITLGSNIIGVAQRHQIKIAEYNFHPFVAGYIPTPVPIPVVILPKLGVYVGIDPTNVNPLSVRVKQDANSETGLIYRNRDWNTTSDFSNDFDFSNPVISRDLELRAFAGPSLEFMLYGVAGPFGSVGGRLRLNHHDNSWELYGGFGASLGVRMEVFKRGVSLQFRDIINREWLLIDGRSGEDNDSTFTDPRDGQTYEIIRIGSQIWMAENLNYEHPNSRFYEDDSSNGEIYGRLYGWTGARESIPSGWKLPTQNDWETLINYLGGQNTSVAGKMKSTGTIEGGTGLWHSPNTGATNESGFSAIPGGFRNDSFRGFEHKGYHSYFWEDEPNSLSSYRLTNTSEYIGAASYTLQQINDISFSVRCVKEEE